MALKPLPKLILIVAAVGGLGFGLTQINLKKYLPGKDNTIAAIAAIADKTPAGAAAPAPTVASAKQLAVSIVSFHGYAPAIVANGGALETKAGSTFDKLGLNLKLVIQDNVPAANEILTSKVAQCFWRTSDFWAQEQPNLRNAGFDARAVMVVDNTQGGDAAISKDPSIKTIEDLAGKSVALLQFTPSHGLLLNAIENSSLTGKKKASVKIVPINADEGTAGVRAALESGKVDAAVLWDPDLALAIKSTGAHVIYSTKQATNLIFDVMVCDKKLLDSADGKVAVQKFVTGWMEGVKQSKANPDLAVQALIDTEDLFAALAKKEGNAFIKSLFSNVVWTDVTDNARILGLTGDTNHYERVYKEFDGVYRAAGALANPASPVIDPSQSFDYSFIKTLVTANTVAAAKQLEPTFSTEGRASTVGASLTKPVLINFESGSSELTAKAKKTIDTDMVPFIENNGAAYIELSGNADSVGSASVNRPLSLARATAVASYLTKQWEIPTARLKVVGNGSDKPICAEAGNRDGLSIDECRALNRTTRVGILSR